MSLRSGFDEVKEYAELQEGGISYRSDKNQLFDGGSQEKVQRKLNQSLLELVTDWQDNLSSRRKT